MMHCKQSVKNKQGNQRENDKRQCGGGAKMRTLKNETQKADKATPKTILWGGR